MFATLRHVLVRLARWVALGALTLAPLLVTVWLATFLLGLTASLGAALLRPLSPLIGPALASSEVLQVLVAVAVLALAGALVGSPLGRRIGVTANRVVDQTPVAKTVYRGVEKILTSFQGVGDDTRKVVLIEFPSPEMKAVGLVTRRFKAADTGQELAAVYVPTTPNPSSGYIEIVPVERLVWLDWSANEAVQFIMSGGVIGPDQIAYHAGGPAARRPPPPESAAAAVGPATSFPPAPVDDAQELRPD